MDPVQVRILEKAEELFSKYGYSKTKMEEIASSLKISRKTLYKYYSNKQDLMEFFMEYRQNEIQKVIQQIANDESLTAVQKFSKLHQSLIEESPYVMNDLFIREVSEMFPQQLERFKKRREKEIPESIGKIFQMAKMKGELREGYMPEVAVHLFLSSIEMILSNKNSITIPLNIHEFQAEVVNVIFYGVLKR
ncbi:TetR/AcrR family transcriptional regulator [Leptospira kanakyensis]|uniref:TetR/AcrR family transcriptional regulator n=1 Tax=Leptospira kanakyensis TaxID=2484968 RepID=A0A6N4QQA7_9LEPT|nr:TetR/AcrR family transcriptional regulator [Leptospira kanakyensis]MCW7468472.1 TetR/AcrR family transcriptional regulator [Leptospira kanakyensis]MCW7482849.1 TetR/AcrR family transcriptional regulator [Leptospira kanakyensis]TGK55542.1 TetR/AcrR family transcriptional regulator [Leptospira kanakyensis]TGK61078.1 TetR/AcrR family transcriptional regulator [Leptospira kanakyensis]TGK76450.1 TetR/AcrR family transcriptional regulator [Leptospira kanakyensis]